MDVVAGHRIIAPLGRGTAGVAYLASAATRLGRAEPVVVKVLDRVVADDELDLVADRLGAVADLREATVVELVEVGLHQGHLFIVERFYPAGSLDRADAADPSPRTDSAPHTAAVIQTVADAALGVHAMHEVGVVHRGVTPGNILVAEGRGVVAEPSLATLVAPGLTSTGAGTLLAVGYLEPEVVWGEPAGRATDIWALGVTLHQVLTGRGVHPGLGDCSVAEAFRHILHTRPVLDDALAPAAAEVIERCLAARRTDRYATAQDAARAIAALVPSGGGTVPEPPELPADLRVVPLGRGPADRRSSAVGDPLPVEGASPVGDLDGLGVVVRGRRCARGHLNRPDAEACSRCGIKLVAAGAALVEGLRPPLGVLTVDDGSSLSLVTDVVVGREPGVDDLVISGRAVALRIVDDARTVSRAHAVVRLVEWAVVVEDRASANGTFLRAAPHEPWHRLAPGEQAPLAPGASIRLGERELTFESH